FDERTIVDAGFLELVRLGIKSPRDPLIAKSVAVVDQVIKVETPNGASFYRYNHDGYGEMDDGRPWNFDGKYTGKGRLWALLTGERGEYELARGERAAARRRLDEMMNFANEGLMIPEQVWDKPALPRPDFKFGEGTGSATPLAWSMAGFIRLAASLEEGRNIMLPDVVAARYVKQPVPPNASVAPAEEPRLRLEAGATLPFGAQFAPGTRAFFMNNHGAREIPVDARGRVSFDAPVPAGDSIAVFAVVSPTGATSFQRARVRGLTAEERRKEEQAEQTPAFVERLRTATTSPVIDGDRAVFVYRGPARRVEVAGDFTSWAPDAFGMTAVPGTDIRYLARRFARGARVEYK
ncbi:MAG: glycoside hydrolase family 15 protein, partial [Pyrinomonadaceae bacterium]